MRKILAVVVLTAVTASIAFAKVGGGDILFPVKGAANVTFNHDRHLAIARLTCTDCHASLYITREKHKKVSMARMGKGLSCGACHNGKKAFDVKSKCDTCHKK